MDLQGAQAVAIGSYEGRASVEPDVWMSCHQAAVPEPAGMHTSAQLVTARAPMHCSLGVAASVSHQMSQDRQLQVS